MHYVTFTVFSFFSIFITGQGLVITGILLCKWDECLQNVAQEELKTGYRFLHPVLTFSVLPFRKKIAKLHALVSYSYTVTLSFHKFKLWKFRILLMPPIRWTCYFSIMKQTKLMTFLTTSGPKLSPCRCSVTVTWGCSSGSIKPKEISPTWG